MRRAALLVVVAACGDGGAAPDAGPRADAAPIELPICDPSFDGVRAFNSRLLELLPPDQGRDVDGDGTIDNQIGQLAAAVNPAFADSITAGGITLLVLPGLTIPPPAAPTLISFFIPDAHDADDPPDPSNNLTDGEFLLSQSTFNASCQPRRTMTVEQNATSLSGAADLIDVPTPAGLAAVRAVALDAEIAPDGSLLTSWMTGAYTSCALDRLSYPGPVPGSVLRVIAGFMQPDVDLDGDGLEIIEAEGDTIVRCIDGPLAGATVIESASCACDPAIADGFSFAIRAEGVPARIVGTRALP